MSDAMEMVDRVAQAMRKGRPNNPDVPWAEIVEKMPGHAEEWRVMARAAIVAMSDTEIIEGYRLAYAEAEVEIRDLKRAIWLILMAAGGRVEVDGRTIATWADGRSEVIRFDEPRIMGATFAARLIAGATGQ